MSVKEDLGMQQNIQRNLFVFNTESSKIDITSLFYFSLLSNSAKCFELKSIQPCQCKWNDAVNLCKAFVMCS